jgi:anti-sigma factor RsiW
MDDDELESRLRAYGPAGPPPTLRRRVLSAAVRPRSTVREWLPALAASLIAVLFYWLAASDRSRLLTPFPYLSAEDIVRISREVQP